MIEMKQVMGICSHVYLPIQVVNQFNKFRGKTRG